MYLKCSRSHHGATIDPNSAHFIIFYYRKTENCTMVYVNFSFAWLCIYAAKYLTKELHISDLNHWWQCFGQCLTSVEPRAFIYERRISWKTGQNGRKTGEKWYVHSEKLILLCIRAAMKGPSHPGSLPPDGFRKTADGGHLKW